ncbi:MAG: GntR family transcriptional regulator [Alphaproteobacteria bacterium]|nr:GntR family transcriptional regulator [Alphaproteobacteria bacterium]
MSGAAERILDRLRGDIVSGHLRSGTHLKIDYLAARYDSSHMPIREALRLLEGEGLIVREPNRGARVRAVDPRSIATIFEVRISIESMLARRAAALAAPADIALLEDVQDAIEARSEAGDTEGAIALNRRFHNIIEDIADHADAAAIANRQCELLDSLWRVYGVDPSRLGGVNSDHRYIIQALRDRCPETAAILVTAHIIKGRMDLVRRMLEASAP